METGSTGSVICLSCTDIAFLVSVVQVFIVSIISSSVFLVFDDMNILAHTMDGEWRALRSRLLCSFFLHYHSELFRIELVFHLSLAGKF